MAMARNSPHHLMIAVGIPRPAHDDEADDDGFDNQPEEELLSKIYSGLREGDEATAHAALGLARCLQEMAHAAMKGDEDKLKEWNGHLCDVVNELEGSDSGEEDD
jgi:hypothetical protein